MGGFSMNTEQCLHDIAQMGLNLYDAAFYTDDGVFARKRNCDSHSKRPSFSLYFC